MSDLSKLSMITNYPSLVGGAFDDYLKSFEQKIKFTKRITVTSIVWDVIAEQSILTSFMSDIKEDRVGYFTDLDYILWPNAQIEPPKLLVFDMDSTFIQIEVIDELAKCHGVGESVAKVTESAMRGELDFSESLVSRVSCLEGLSESSIEEISNRLPLSEGVSELVTICHKLDIKIAIVSGGFTPFVGRLKEIMDLYRVKANTLEIENGQLTGRVLGKIVDAKEKAVFVKDLIRELDLNANQVMTLGDGANDLLMMAETGFNLAYRAKPAVQKQAKGRMNITHLNQLADVFNW